MNKIFTYIVVALDLLAMLVSSSIFSCIGSNASECQKAISSPVSWLIIVVAVFSTSFYLYKRFKANLPLLPFSFSSNVSSAGPKIITPLKNKIIFGFFSFLMMMSYFVSPYHYTQGADTPPYAHWAFYAIPIMVGLVFITLKDEIKLRLHAFWTPFGLLYMAFAWGLVTFDGLPIGAALGYSLFDSIGEGFWFATGFGLMLAFVGLKPMYKRAFYFLPLAFFGGIFGTIELTRQIQGILVQKPVEWGAYLDLTWLMGGYFAIYLIVKRLIKDRPPIKTMAVSAVLFVLIVFINLVVAQNLVSKAFPKNSWQHHWLSGYLPAYNVQCSGAECSNIIYLEPYSFCVNGNPIDRENPSQFYSVAQSRVAKGCWYKLNTDTRNLQIVCSRPVTVTKEKAADLPVVECGNARFDGAYGGGLGGNELRQKELYDLK